jgi:RimJ/RimL family protein N-acetyltransferase
MVTLDFSKDYILENDYVKLSPLKLEHIGSLIEISKDPNIWTYFLEKGNGLDNLAKYINNAVNNRTSGNEYPFIIFDKIKNHYAGTTRFYDYSAEIRTIKLGHTWLCKDFRGTGLNKHCKYLLFAFAFEKLKIERVGFGAHAKNKVSIAAMKSIGCKEEGVLRNFIPSLDGKGRADIVLLSILKDEWFKVIKKELQQKLTKN